MVAYDLAGGTITIFLKGERLIVLIDGQPNYELVPYKDSEFNMKDCSEFSIKFTQNALPVLT